LRRGGARGGRAFVVRWCCPLEDVAVAAEDELDVEEDCDDETEEID
jgi:hypothetical protein